MPVKPVWPNEPIGNSSPRFDEKLESRSQPRPRTLGSAAGVDGAVIRATDSGERIRRPSSVPWPRSMRQKRARSSAVVNIPAWPATPPIRRAVGSCTTPRSIGGAGVAAAPGTHGSFGGHRSVGAIRGTSAAPGRNAVSRMPSGAKMRSCA